MRQLTWIDQGGAATSLSALGAVFAAPGVQVAGMPAIRASEIQVPLQPGSRWRQVSHGAREIAVPIHVTGDVEATMDLLVRAVDPARGDGRLRVTRSDGGTRDLWCRYVEALKPVEATDRMPVWSAALIFRAVDPYWYDTATQSVVVQPEQGPGFFPFFPLTLGASEATDQVVVSNDGHAEAWPIWTITGPGTFTAVNNTTDKTLDLSGYELADGESIVIDTTPGVKSVESSTAGTLFAELSADSSLWPVVVGANDISFTVSGASDATRLRMTWQRRFLTA